MSLNSRPPFHFFPSILLSIFHPLCDLCSRTFNFCLSLIRPVWPQACLKSYPACFWDVHWSECSHEQSWLVTTGIGDININMQHVYIHKFMHVKPSTCNRMYFRESGIENNAWNRVLEVREWLKRRVCEAFQVLHPGAQAGYRLCVIGSSTSCMLP